MTYPLTEFTKVLVITGVGPENNFALGKLAEIIDLENSKAKCASLPDFPEEFFSSVGGLLDNKPVICGGFDHKTGMSNQCFELDDNKIFQPSKKLSTERSNAAAVVIDNKVIQPEKILLSSCFVSYQRQPEVYRWPILSAYTEYLQ